MNQSISVPATKSHPSADLGNAYLEIAAYTVKEPDSFTAIRAAAMGVMQELASGLLWWQPLVSDDQVYVDLVAWTSPEAAHKAGELMKQDPRFKPFMGALAALQHFAHYYAEADAETLGSLLAQATVVEIALYKVKDEAIYAKQQPVVFERLWSRPGLLGATHLKADQMAAGYGDLFLWRSAEAAESAEKALMEAPDLADFFQGIDQDLYAKFRRDAAQ